MSKYLKILILLFIFPTMVLAQSSLSKLNGAIDALKKDRSLEHADWGIIVKSQDSNKIITAYNENQSLIPASTLKIATTGAALSILGTDYCYKTKLQYDGYFDKRTGIIHGNLFIRGAGDPSLGSKYFRKKKDTLDITQRWAEILKEKGVKKIEGAVIADASAFEYKMTPDNWIWGDMGNYYGAAASGLIYRDNRVNVFFKAGSRRGSAASIVKMIPDVPYLKIDNEVTAGGRGDHVYFYGAPYSDKRLATGTVPASCRHFDVEASTPDPALLCALSLEKALQKDSINVLKPATTVRKLTLQKVKLISERKDIYIHQSPPLDSIVHFTNLHSVNLNAEAILKTLSYQATGLGTDTGGIRIVEDFWKSKGIALSGMYMVDGCGLSRANTITVSQEAEMLDYLAKDSSVYPAFYKSLPIAGKSGSLKFLCRGTCGQNNIHAKSGYLTRARGYAGYVKDRKGERLVFVMLANNYECSAWEMKRKFEKLMVLIARLE